MKKKLLYRAICVSILLCASHTFAQTSDWLKKENITIVENLLEEGLDKNKVQFYELNFTSLKQNLQAAPLRDLNNTSNRATPSKTIVSLPVHDGAFETFYMYEAPVFASELSAKYPGIKSYVGVCVNNPMMRLRMSVSHLGVQTMISTPDKPMLFMQPVELRSKDYVLYNRSAREATEFECSTIAEITKNINNNTEEASRSSDANDQLLRKYRIAVSTTGEYSQYFGGTIADGLAAINLTIARVNEVYETDMSATFEVISNNDLVVFTDALFDPYRNQGTWNADVQSTLTSLIGEANYDIGHLFAFDDSVSIEGNAGCIGCVCEDNNKGSGWSAGGTPENDDFAISLVAHEIGHQMGAFHTFSFQTEGTGTNVEPGSGSTIMAYAGITGSNNVQSSADPYFNYTSINLITNNFSNQTCWTSTAIANKPPVTNAGQDYIIPQGTAYVLRGSETTDPDGGDTLMYCWEQIDSGEVTDDTFGSTLTAGAMTRSLPPTTSPDRYIPNINRIVVGQLTETNPTNGSDWETVATVARDLNWALTVRDREATALGLGGQTSFDTMKITVEDVAPFIMTSQNSSGINWSVGTEQIITWDVGETTNTTINCQAINIKLSTDGGLTYPILLACNTANDGSEPIVVPDNASATCRIMVEAADNIFFDISDEDLQITSPGSASFLIEKGDLCVSYELCTNTNIDIDIDLTTIGAFAGTATFSASDLPTGVSANFTPTSLSANGTTTMTLSNFGSVTPGEHIITVTGVSGAITRDISVILNVFSASIAAPTLTSPANGTSSILRRPELTWAANANAESYLVEVSTNIGFSNIIQSNSVSTNSYTSNLLNTATTYYWRVTSSNNCATGPASSPNSFTTVNPVCDPLYTATDTPIAMGTSDPGTFQSVISVTDDFAIADVNVTIDIIHSYATELIITLTSPNGTDVILSNLNGNSGRPNDNFSVTVFDQEASNPIGGGAPPFNGTFIPDGDLSNIYGEMSAGDWTLTVEDTEPGDGGSIDGFSIELCLDQPLSIENITLTDFSVYPNPNKGEFNVRLNSTSGEDVKIIAYDIRGRKIYDNKFNSTGYFNESINLGQVQSGIYLLHVSDGLSTQIKKVVIK